MPSSDSREQLAGDRLHPVVIDVWFPHGPSVDWQVLRLRGTEAISSPYELDIELCCDDPLVDTEALLGSDCELLLDRDGVARALYGVVAELEVLASAETRVERTGLAARVRVVPAFKLLEQTVDTRFFAGQTVVEILREVLQPALADYERQLDVESRLKGRYERRDYCVQFRESTFAFCNRIMEEEGIAYIFVHDEESQRELLLLIDNNEDYEPVELLIPGAVPIVQSRAEELDRESLQSFDWRSARTSNRVVTRGYNMKVPHPPDEGEAELTDAQRPVVRELFHDGEQRQITDDPVDDPDAQTFTGAALAQRATQAKRLLEAHTLGAERGRGRSNALGFVAGRVFRLGDHPNPTLANHKFLLLRVSHEAERGDGPDHAYANRFECIPFERPFRPALKTPRPRVHGVQTGVVVGRTRDEVYTDQFGRVRVKFHRDRRSQADEHASCWIRVAQIWAGPGYGSLVIPRVGMEVVVSFVDGNPDCPIITGCVYDGANMPPYALPSELSKTTFKTNSTPNGDGFNELRIEDAHGSEQIFVHAQRRMDLRVRGSLYETSGGSREEVIGGEHDGQAHGDHNTLVHKDVNHHVKEIRYSKVDQQEYASVGADVIEDFQARHVVLVGELSQLSAPKIVVEASELVSNKADEIRLSGSTTVSVKGGGKVVVESNNAIELKVGNSFVSITPDGVSIQGLTVRLNSGGGVGSASEADTAVAAELLEPLDALAADDGRPGGGGRGGGGGRSRNSRTLEPHRAPPMKPAPPLKPGHPTVLPDGKIRQLLSLAWKQPEIWCSDTATLWGTTKNYQAGDTELATITNAVDGAVQRGIVVPIETAVFTHSFDVLDVLPRHSATGYEAERMLHASIAGLTTPVATRMRFIPNLPGTYYNAGRCRFDISVTDYEIVVGGTIKYVLGQIHSMIHLGDKLPPGAGGDIGSFAVGKDGWRYCKAIYNRARGQDDYFFWDGSQWVLVPSDWSDPEHNLRLPLGIWVEGGIVRTQAGNRQWPDDFETWHPFSLKQLERKTAEWKSLIEEFWTGNYDIKRESCHGHDPTCCRYRVRCSVNFERADTLDGHAIIIGELDARSNSGAWSMYGGPRMPIHEFGHHLGNPDEYTGAATVDPSVNTDGAKAGIDKKSIMGGEGMEVRRRHMKPICEALSKAVLDATGQKYSYTAVAVVPP